MLVSTRTRESLVEAVIEILALRIGRPAEMDPLPHLLEGLLAECLPLETLVAGRRRPLSIGRQERHQHPSRVADLRRPLGQLDPAVLVNPFHGPQWHGFLPPSW